MLSPKLVFIQPPSAKAGQTVRSLSWHLSREVQAGKEVRLDSTLLLLQVLTAVNSEHSMVPTCCALTA